MKKANKFAILLILSFVVSCSAIAQSKVQEFWAATKYRRDFGVLPGGVNAWLVQLAQRSMNNPTYSDVLGKLEGIDEDKAFQNVVFQEVYNGWAKNKEGMRMFLNGMCGSYSIANPVSDYILSKYQTKQGAREATNKGSTETPNVDKKKVLDALRPAVEKELKQKVKFVVQDIKSCQKWVLVKCKPVGIDGSDIDYSGTPYQEQINEGMFDEGIQALLTLKNNVWVLKEIMIGATDSPLIEWTKMHNIEACLEAF